MKVLDWVALEDRISDILGETMRRQNLVYHRFYDSKSAGSLLPAQPADFLVVSQGKTTLIEAKFSEVHESLRSCFSNNVSDHQCASARVWARAGADYFFLFYSSKSGRAETWEGTYCANRRALGKPLALNGNPARTVYPNIKSAVGGLLQS